MREFAGAWRRTRGRGVALAGLVFSLSLAGCGENAPDDRDAVPPARVRDLAVAEVGDSTATLTWTAPGDDGTLGTAASYDIRRFTGPPSDQDWESGTPLPGQPAPAPSGTLQSVVAGSLEPLATHHFALRAADEASNWSTMSNQAVAIPGPAACESPDTVRFGSVQLGSFFEVPVVLRNAGGGTLSGTAALDCPSDFSIVSGSGPFALRAGERRTVLIRFAPSQAGDTACRLQTGACADVALLGVGSADAWPPLDIFMGNPTRFVMGSPLDEPGRDPDEVEHSVGLSRSLKVSDHEVTQAEWLEQMNWNDSPFWGADLPVQNVTWFDALLYCNRRSAQEGLTPAYGLARVLYEGNHIVGLDSTGVVDWDPTANGYRLPTEAEWEFLARAGSHAAFHTGDITVLGNCVTLDPALDEAGWYCGNSGEDGEAKPQPVRRKSPNPLGIFDAHGNVAEWCWDFYGPYDPLDQNLNPSGPASGTGRVVRGGSYAWEPEVARAAFRRAFAPGHHGPEIGLRVVRNL